MKHFITLILLAFTLNSAWSQILVPNGGFENWYNVVVSAELNYDDIGVGATDNWMATLNSLALVPPSAWGPGPVTVFKTADKHAGNYAAKAVSAIFQLGEIPLFIPGMIGTAKLDMVGIRAILGRPCPDCRPLRFKGYFKFEPEGEDSCAAVILLSKWNTSTKKRDTIGYGKMVQHSPVPQYTQFDIPINYTESTAVVDTMTMLIVSSAGFNVINFMGSRGNSGTTMYVDDLTLDYPAGIQQILMPEVAVNVYPNPANDILHIDLSKDVNNGSIEVYNSAGKMVCSFGLAQKTNTIPVYNLATGAYYYRFISGKELLNTGSFMIKK